MCEHSSSVSPCRGDQQNGDTEEECSHRLHLHIRYATWRGRVLETAGPGKTLSSCRRVTRGSRGLTQPLTTALEEPQALYQVRRPVIFACTRPCRSPNRDRPLAWHAPPT